MSNTPDLRSFGKFVPGFDFLQNLAKQAANGTAQSIPQLPNLGNWVAPTLNVEELDKRIEELKAVQFWLDQNATALKATITALEVQKMTLATLKGMNFNLGDVANAFKLKAADTVMSGVNPTQLWGALTQQFGQIAAGAMKDAAKQTAIDVTKSVATDMAKGAFKKATGMAGAVGKAMTSARTAPKTTTTTKTKTTIKATTQAAPKKPATKVAAKKRAR
jgi:hypothetical protein